MFPLRQSGVSKAPVLLHKTPRLRLGRWDLFKALAAIVCLVGTVSLAVIYLFPAPPSKISIATAFKGGAYELFGQRYQQILAHSGVKSDVLLTDGSVENLKLLQDRNSGVHVAFVQGGVSNSNQASEVLSLGRINYQLFWVFHRATETLDEVAQLKGKRIAVGPIGSGTQVVAAKILGVSGVNADTATLLPLAGQKAVKALNDGEADVIFLAFAPDAPIIQSLLRDPNVRLMSFPRGEALTRIFPFLVRLVLPQGVIDFEKNIPANDLPLIGTTNAVLVRNDIHPALIGLLAQALKETHSEAGLFQRVEEFPTQIDPEYPIAAGAIDFYKNGPSLLYQYLPFQIVTYVRRLLAVSLAGIAVFFPLFNYAPKLYLWLVRERMSKIYRRLRVVEKALQTKLTAPQIKVLQNDLANIDQVASSLWVPMRHSGLFFSLKVHIDLIRTRLTSRLDEVRSRTANASLSEYGLDDVHTANEVGVSPSQLHELPKGSSDANFLKSMLVALQVDAKAITDMNPLIMRQLRWLCITCDNKKRCEHEFAKGTATEHFREFCPNAVSIDELVDQKGQLSSH
jgi:uncharacterized protein